MAACTTYTVFVQFDMEQPSTSELGHFVGAVDSMQAKLFGMVAGWC